MSEAPLVGGPQGSALVARLRSGRSEVNLFAAVGPEPVRCGGCAVELGPRMGCFTVQRFGPAGVPFPVCTACEPLPDGAALITELHLHRECAHPGCRHPRLVSRLRRSGPSLERAELEWEHEAPESTWGPRGTVHRPRPGPAIA